MNAIEFVKKHGIDKAKDLACRDKTSIGYLSIEHHNLNQEELKQIVDAFDCVMEHGSVEHAKKYAESDYTAPEVKQFLLKAINLVEKCNA